MTDETQVPQISEVPKLKTRNTRSKWVKKTSVKRHRKVVKLRNQGYSNAQIAKEVGVPESSISGMLFYARHIRGMRVKKSPSWANSQVKVKKEPKIRKTYTRATQEKPDLVVPPSKGHTDILIRFTNNDPNILNMIRIAQILGAVGVEVK